VVTVLLSGCGASASSTPSTASNTPTAGVNVRLPARFTILPGAAVSPPTVTVPARIPLELIVVSKDGRAHRVRLEVPSSRPISVPPGSRVEQLLPALPSGTYGLLVDGERRAALHVDA
jgi:hypothetical protein